MYTTKNRKACRTYLLSTAMFICTLTTAFAQSQLQQDKSNNNTTSKIELATLVEKGQSNEYVITAQHISRVSGVHHIYLRQAIDGIEVYGTESSIHKTPAGSVFRTNNNFVSNIEEQVLSNRASINAATAISSVANQMGYNLSNLQLLETKNPLTQEAVYNGGGISVSNIPVKLMYYYREGIGVQMVWELSVEEYNSADWWNFRVDATTGNIIDKNNFTVSCLDEMHDHAHGDEKSEIPYETPLYYTVPEEASMMVGTYNVIPMPIESPGHGSRVSVSDPDNAVASPYGWHDTNGSPGAESNYTIGNNCDAYDDSSSTVTGTGSGTNDERAFGGAGLTFNFPFNTNVTVGDGSIDAAVTNLFYWTNIIHDVVYQYGFDEASGNFQVNNYGNGGAGNDSVRAEAQDGSGTCNANFATPSDGNRPRMQMYVCGTRDGDFDNGVIVHEYGHGISNRLTGGPAASGCLGNQEQMGEGWSDYYGLMLTMDASDARDDSRGIGTWLVGQAPTGPGIRTYPYSTNFAVNPHTYADTSAEVAPHGVGSVWCAMLWEMTWDLIDQEGFDPDIYNGTGGNNIALNLVTEGMKLQACSPGFVDGRDAILAADQAIYGGAYNCLIWEAFARRGLGFSANQGSSNNKNDNTEAFDLPPGLGTPDMNASLQSVCVTSGVQTGLSGGLPEGGVYSGTGVTDDGNGQTFSFDPSVGGVGTTTVTYTITNLCSGSVENDTDTITVGDSTLAIVCPEDITTCDPDISFEFPRPADGCFGRSSNRVTQNTVETNNGSIDCDGELSGHLRQFNLTTEGVSRDYLITGIDVGINTTTGANITVNIYLNNTIDNPITSYVVPISTNVTPYATATSAVPAGSVFTHTVPFDVFLPAGTAFTVEVISPASQSFMIAYNDSGVFNNPNDTTIGYTSCISGLPYSDLSDFDFGANSVLIAVQGTESDFLTTVQTTGITTGETYPLGVTTNTFETTDSSTGDSVSCSFDVNVLGDSVTQFVGGAWNNGAPTSTARAIISDDYDTAAQGNIDACDCDVEAETILTVGPDDYLNIQYNINVEGTLNVAHTGSIVQSESSAIVTNNGTINVDVTTPVLQTRDFMVMGSPMDGETRNDVFDSAFLVLNSTPGNFLPHPEVPTGGTNFADDNGDFWNSYSGAINVGEGYIVRPQSGYTDPANTTYDMTYSLGTLNNGDVTRPIVFNGLATNPSGTPNVLANPYASAIDADQLIADNALIGEVYFWEHLTPPSSSIPGAGGINFSMGDISMYNTSMALPAANDPGTTTTPNGVIATAQGFGIKAQAAGTVTFSNDMRLTSGNTTLRNPEGVDKLTLRVFHQEYGIGSYAGIAFNPTASEGWDVGYDTQRLATAISLFSQLQDGKEQLAIQTLPSFESGMKIPMGFASQVTADTAYTITIADIAGDNLSQASVYLIDNVLNTITDLTQEDYTFRSNEGTFEGRFTLQFEYEVLGTNDLNQGAFTLYPNPTKDLVTISATTPITQVAIYDLQGRLVQTHMGQATRQLTVTTDKLTAAMYFVTVTTQEGTLTKRLVKQ